MANSVDPDELLCSAASHLGPNCSLRPICLNSYHKYSKFCFLYFQADPYIQVKLGSKKLDSRDEYIPNTLNPVFGK